MAAGRPGRPTYDPAAAGLGAGPGASPAPAGSTWRTELVAAGGCRVASHRYRRAALRPDRHDLPAPGEAGWSRGRVQMGALPVVVEYARISAGPPRAPTGCGGNPLVETLRGLPRLPPRDGPSPTQPSTWSGQAREPVLAGDGSPVSASGPLGGGHPWLIAHLGHAEPPWRPGFGGSASQGGSPPATSSRCGPDQPHGVRSSRRAPPADPGWSEGGAGGFSGPSWSGGDPRFGPVSMRLSGDGLRSRRGRQVIQGDTAPGGHAGRGSGWRTRLVELTGLRHRQGGTLMFNGAKLHVAWGT